MKLQHRLAAACVSVLGATALATVNPLAAGPAHAADYYYGAIALDTSTGATGRAWDYPNMVSAENAAIVACGSIRCQIVVSFYNGCGAVSSSENYWGFGAAEDLYTAQSYALYRSDGGYITDWVCTTGHA